MPHIHEKIDFVADIYVVCKDKVLIRKHDKYKMWLAVGGHVELDETPDVAAIRETKEEVGLDITLVSPREIPLHHPGEHVEIIPPWYMNIHPINNTHKHIGFIYFATSETDAVIPECPEDEWKWLSAEELELNELQMPESILFYAKEALRQLS